jgi:hypothetical protein
MYSWYPTALHEARTGTHRDMPTLIITQRNTPIRWESRAQTIGKAFAVTDIPGPVAMQRYSLTIPRSAHTHYGTTHFAEHHHNCHHTPTEPHHPDPRPDPHNPRTTAPPEPEIADPTTKGTCHHRSSQHPKPPPTIPPAPIHRAPTTPGTHNPPAPPQTQPTDHQTHHAATSRTRTTRRTVSGPRQTPPPLPSTTHNTPTPPAPHHPKQAAPPAQTTCPPNHHNTDPPRQIDDTGRTCQTADFPAGNSDGADRPEN